ncbi:MAG: hypothetical protein JWN44_7205 [Myxococcales bacterium]|nr:hypothetical protein [Myxococcales bacterium]
MDKLTNESAREPYEAPAIEDIPLRGEEQLLAGCKQPGQNSPSSAGNFCNVCMVPGAS